jgi:hypothetical protein
MKSVYLIFIIIIFSCNHLTQRTKSDLCFSSDFSKQVEKVSLNDTGRIRKLNGRFIQIEGYLTYEFENVALYPIKWSESTKALWLNFSDTIIKNREDLMTINYKAVAVIGKVNILHNGHSNGYLAELDSVFCIKEK